MTISNSITYQLLKKQIKYDIEQGKVNYKHRLNMINTFETKVITIQEAQELRSLIEIYKEEVQHE